MAKKEIKVKFKTITPLWTGDAWQDNKEIRPSSLIGSLRFWFEVICYFSGICKEDDFRNGRFEKEVDRKDFRNCLADEGNFFKAKIKCLLEQDIPLPSIIFGTTNWKSLIRIKEIEYLDDYSFEKKLNLPYAIGIKKDNPENIEEFPNKEDWKNKINSYGGGNFKEKLKKAKKEFSFFFFNNPYFYGNFQVKFEVEEEIIEPIFYPLLTFMDKYGFWGGKWNIGYGRLKVSDIEENEDNIPREIWEKENFEFFNLANSQLDKENIDFSNFLKIENDFSSLLNINESNKKIKILLKNKVISNDLKETIKKLIEIKVKARVRFKENVELRHKIFGTTKPPPNNKDLLPQGSKILPYISKENGNFKGSFISIVDLLSLEGENNG